MKEYDLSDIIGNVQQPVFDNDMIKRLAEMFIRSNEISVANHIAGKPESIEVKKNKFYKAIQNENCIKYVKELDDTMIKRLVEIAKECNNNDFLSNIGDKIKSCDLEDKIHINEIQIKELAEGARIDDVSKISEKEIKQMFKAKDNASIINREEERELGNKKNLTWYQDKMFKHMGDQTDIDYVISRLYVNCEKQDLMKLANLFTDKCSNKGIPNYFKYISNDNVRSDQFVIYSNLKELKNYIQILQEIGEENPDIVKRCGKPPLLTGKINEWIGIGDEPRKSGESYTTLRSDIIYDVLKGNVQESDEFEIKNLNFSKIKEELKNAFEGIGIDINTFAFNNENLQLYMSDEKIRSNYDIKRKQYIKEYRNKPKPKTKEELDLEEKVTIQELKILEKLGGNFKAIKTIINATDTRNKVFADLYPNYNSKEIIEKKFSLNNNIKISDNFELKNITIDGKNDLTDEQQEEINSKVMNDVTNYYKEYVDSMEPLMDNILNQYTELLGREDNLSREKLSELDSKLKVLADGKVFFKEIGISDEKLKLTSDIAYAFREELDRKNEEKNKADIKKGKSKIDKELLGIMYEENKITDKEELRKFYKNLKNFDVSEKDLEDFLSSIDETQPNAEKSNDEKTTPVKEKINVALESVVNVLATKDPATGVMFGKFPNMGTVRSKSRSKM